MKTIISTLAMAATATTVSAYGYEDFSTTPYSEIEHKPKDPDPYVCTGFQIVSTEKGHKACLHVGEAICRDNGHLGEWKFGLDATNDGAVTLWGPDDEVIFSTYEGSTALCINIIDHEYWKYHYPAYWNHYEYSHQYGGRRLGNKKYPEEPYLIIYGDKKKYAELWCKGVHNTGKNAQLKMTDLSSFTPILNEKFDVVKFKMGSLPNDPINALLTVDVKLVVPYYHDKYPLEKHKFEPEVQGGIHVNEEYCHWKQYPHATPAPTVSLAPSVSPAPTYCVRDVHSHCSVKYQDCCEEDDLYCAPDDYASYFAAHQPWSHPPAGKCAECIPPKHLCHEDYECCDDASGQDHICSEYIDGHKYCVPDCQYKGHCKEDSDCCSGICDSSYGNGHYKFCRVDSSP